MNILKCKKSKILINEEEHIRIILYQGDFYLGEEKDDEYIIHMPGGSEDNHAYITMKKDEFDEYFSISPSKWYINYFNYRYGFDSIPFDSKEDAEKALINAKFCPEEYAHVISDDMFVGDDRFDINDVSVHIPFDVKISNLEPVQITGHDYEVVAYIYDGRKIIGAKLIIMQSEAIPKDDGTTEFEVYGEDYDEDFHHIIFKPEHMHYIKGIKCIMLSVDDIGKETCQSNWLY